MDNLVAAGLLLAALQVNHVWRWVGPGTPVRRSLLIAPGCVAAGAGLLLALRGMGFPAVAWLAAGCCWATGLAVVVVPVAGRLSRGGPPSPPGTGG